MQVQWEFFTWLDMVAMVMQKMGGKFLHPIEMVRYMATSGSSYLAVG